MAFPSTSGSNPVTLTAALANAMQLAGTLKSQANSLLSLAQTTGIPANQLINLPQNWTQAVTQLNAYAALSGMAAFAQAQLGDASISTDFSTMTAAVTACVTWITTNFPTSNGYLLAASFGSGGAITYVTFTPTQLAGFVTVLEALIAAIN